MSRLLGLCAIALVLTAPGSRARRRARRAPLPRRPLPEPAAGYPQIKITAGRSTVLSTDFDVTRIAVTNPAIADAVVVQPREILVDGKAPGTVSLIIWGRAHREQYDVVVDAGVPCSSSSCRCCFPAKTSASR